MLQFLFSPTKQYQFESGKLLAGGKIYVYLKDTENLATLYNGETEKYTANPIVLDANGRASVKADDTNEYRLEIYTPYDTLLYTCNAFYAGGEGGGEGTFIVRHDDTLSGNGTSQHPLSVVNIPLAVDDTMTAYEDIIDGTNALVLGVNGDWFNDTFGSALSSKVDKDEFSACCNEVKEALDNKLDSSAYDLSNYYNKQETTYLLSNYYNKQEVDDSISIINNLKQDKLEFDYNSNSAISAINGSALAGQGGEDANCPWISGAKEISSMGYLQPGQWFQVLSSFDLSGVKNHCICVKGGAYNFPTTSHFYEWLDLSSYLPITSFTGYSANADSRMTSISNLANSAYTTAVNNFYNKLDVSAFSAWSAVQDPVLIGDANITATSSRVDSHTQWNLAVNVTPVVTDTRLIGDNCVTAHTTDTSGEWIVGLVQSAYEAIDSVGGISSDVDTLKNASGSYYPLTGNPSGFLTSHQTIPSAKWEDASDAVQTNSAQWSENTGDTAVNLYVYNNSAINNEVNNVVTANSANWNTVNDKLDYSAFTAWSAEYAPDEAETYTVSGGNWIDISADDNEKVTTISVTGLDTALNDASGALNQKIDTVSSTLTGFSADTLNALDGKKNIQNNITLTSTAGDVVTAIYQNTNGEVSADFAPMGESFVPWISGTKSIADTQTFTGNMLVQVLSSFDLSGYKNHSINVKGGMYRFPNNYEIASGINQTNTFLTQSAFNNHTNVMSNHLSILYGQDSYLSGRINELSSYAKEVSSTVKSNSANWNNVSNKLDTTAFSTVSGTFLTAHQTIPSAKWEDASDKVRANSAQWAKNDGNTAVNNWVQQNSANCETTNTTVGLNSNFWSNTCLVVMDNSASWGQGGTSFPITSQSGSTLYTLNASSNAIWLTTASGPAGATTRLDVKGVNLVAYPSTAASASWRNIINAANSNNITCSAVKLTTAANETTFYTSALPNLNKITFIAPSYGPYQTYSALIDDGETIFCAKVNSGCCRKVVRCWNDDRNKNCWCGLNQETYFYIG